MSKNSNGLIHDLEKRFDSAVKDNPDWLAGIRTKHKNRYKNVGIPTIKDEEWKYTNVAPLKDHVFNIADSESDIDLNQFSGYINQDDINIVFVNGKFASNLSSVDLLPKGVQFKNLSEALNKTEETIKDLSVKFDSFTQSTFASVNNALHKEGIYINIENNVQSDELIHVIHISDPQNTKTLSIPRNLIVCGQSSEITLLESHICKTDDVYLSTPITDVYMHENAVLHYCNAQDESKNAYHISQIRVWVERNANFDGFSFMTGAQITRNNLDIVINGEGANANLNALYAVTGNQHVDNHSSVDHRVPNCTSNQLYKGILHGSSRAVFNGKIFVKPIAQQTNSYQLNNNLLLGTDCRVDTKPQLEIFADDVKCTHGATIGQLEEDELFYLQTRNISRQKAVDMLSRGFADDALEKITHTGIQDKIHILLEPLFTAL